MQPPTTLENNRIVNWSAVRYVHNVVGAPDLDIYVDKKLVVSGANHTNFSGYVSVGAGHHHLRIQQTGTNAIVIHHRTFIVEPYQYYSIIIHGSMAFPDDLDATLIKDNTSCPVDGRANLRFVHTAYNTPPVDVWMDNVKIFSGVTYQHTGAPAYRPVGVGQHHLSVAYAGSNNFILQNVQLDFVNQNIYTVVASGDPRDPQQPFKLVIAEDDRLC